MHEISIVQSPAGTDASSFKIHTRPLPIGNTRGGSVAAEYSEPLIKKPQNNDVEEAPRASQQVSLAHKSKQINKKLGLLPMTTLVIGTLVIFASLFFFSFLWYGNVNSETW